MPVYMNLQLTGGAAHCVTTMPGGLLPRLFTLTACAAVIFCHLNPTVTRSFPLRNVMLCVARTFLSQPCDVNERQAAILFMKSFGTTKVDDFTRLCKCFATFTFSRALIDWTNHALLQYGHVFIVINVYCVD